MIRHHVTVHQNFGIPIPSTDPTFLRIVMFHSILGIACFISGFIAMISEENNKRHASAGRIYYYKMLISFVSVVIMSVTRLPHNIHLLTIGTMAFLSVFLGGQLARARSRKNWTRQHTILMGAPTFYCSRAFMLIMERIFRYGECFQKLFSGFSRLH